MSRRTSEASKAIRAAWLKEQELIAEGKGTRDWTSEQQKEILELFFYPGLNHLLKDNL